MFIVLLFKEDFKQLLPINFQSLQAKFTDNKKVQKSSNLKDEK